MLFIRFGDYSHCAKSTGTTGIWAIASHTGIRQLTIVPRARKGQTPINNRRSLFTHTTDAELDALTRYAVEYQTSKIDLVTAIIREWLQAEDAERGAANSLHQKTQQTQGFFTNAGNSLRQVQEKHCAARELESSKHHKTPERQAANLVHGLQSVEHMEQTRKAERRKLNARLTLADHNALRMWAIARGIDVEQAVGEAIRQWIERQESGLNK